MKKVYHILTHSLEPFYKELYQNIENIKYVEHHVNKLISKLKKFDKDGKYDHVLILPSYTTKNSKKYIHKDGYEIYLVPSRRFGIYPLEISPQLGRLVKRLQKQKEVVFHLKGISTFLYDEVAFSLKNKKFISHYSGGYFTWKAFPISFLKYELIQKYSLKKSYKIFVQNRTRLEKLRHKYKLKKEQLEWIPSAVDLEDFKMKINKKEMRNKLGFNKNDIIIIFTGRLEKAKGILDLLYAAQKISSRFDNIKFIIAGDGRLKKRVEKFAKNPTLGIYYMGQVKFKKLLQLYKISDIFVLPTYYDSFPNSLLEAMASGLAPVSTLVEGPLEMVQDNFNGFLVKPGDRTSLIKRISELVENRKLRSLFGKRSKKIVKNNFSWEKISKKIFEIYETV